MQNLDSRNRALSTAITKNSIKVQSAPIRPFTISRSISTSIISQSRTTPLPLSQSKPPQLPTTTNTCHRLPSLSEWSHSEVINFLLGIVSISFSKNEAETKASDQPLPPTLNDLFLGEEEKSISLDNVVSSFPGRRVQIIVAMRILGPNALHTFGSRSKRILTVVSSPGVLHWIKTDPVPRPNILSGGSVTPASSRNKASAKRPLNRQNNRRSQGIRNTWIEPVIDTSCNQ
ncbi:hypothetical protein G4B88_011895 [Cannabis sativa]|uniref:Uncharacterized protein n=1 Tax=Cannabis sativa TaxID=3483 RepID=A0A7J6HEW0_CANSA|nr:hypothetical protein G4B88_011895 [Cannabis sativa]